MTFHVDAAYLLSLTLIIYTLLATSLLLISLRQVLVLHKGKKTQRGIYKKRALQSLQLSFVLSFLLFIFSVLDMTFFNKFYALFSQELRFLASFIPVFLAFATLCTLLWIGGIKKEKKYSTSVWAFLSSLFLLKTTLFLVSLSFLFFYNQTPVLFVEILTTQTPTLLPYYAVLNKFFSIMSPIYNYIPLFCAFSLFVLLASETLAYSLQLLYTLFCRKVDDFGRDYYTQSLKVLGRGAFYASLLLTLFMLAVLAGNYFNYLIMPFILTQTSILLLLAPLACINFALIVLSSQPLRHKIAILISPLFIFISSTFFILQTL